MHHTFDRTLFILTLVLVVVGFFIFSSASLGLLARDGAEFSSVVRNQILFGVVGGLFSFFITSSIHYRVWRQYAFYIFLLSMLITLCVFIPFFQFEHGGAKRWIEIGSFTFQPAEILKIAFIIYMATWLSGMKKHIGSFLNGTIPFLLFLGGFGIPLLLQPDTDSFLIVCMATIAMFVTAGGSIRDVFLLLLTGVVLIVILALTRPYIMDRLHTYIDPSRDPQGSGYQIRQSLIAIGSGGIFGRGYGQSIQKFEYLPEPIGDSILAVYAEEFGFIGSLLLVLLFTIFALRGYRIATRSQDLFGMLLVVGIITLIIGQVFLNIASMVGLMPLSGLPLPFVSHGGTALFMTLAAMGIVINVSKYTRQVSTT